MIEREAAERLRQAIMNLPAETTLEGYCRKAYLRGHRDARHAAVELIGSIVPADDDTPIDAKWLRAVGFERFMQPASENSFSYCKLILRRYPRESDWKVYIDGTHWPLKTRGDLRRLASSLGIELRS